MAVRAQWAVCGLGLAALVVLLGQFLPLLTHAHAVRAVSSTSESRGSHPPSPALAAPPLPPSAPCSPLDAQLVRAAAASNSAGIVFATFANRAQLDFALNWIKHLDALNLSSSALVGATDEATVQGLKQARTPAHCFPLSSAIGADEAKWGSPGFSQMGRTKSKLLRTLLGLHATVHASYGANA